MTLKRLAAVMVMAVSLVMLGVLGGTAVIAQDTGPGKYTVQVPGGLAFSEFRGYESWQTVSISHSEKLLAVTLANPEMAIIMAGRKWTAQYEFRSEEHTSELQSHSD